jgi:hypothetical protein
MKGCEGWTASPIVVDTKKWLQRLREKKSRKTGDDQNWDKQHKQQKKAKWQCDGRVTEEISKHFFFLPVK